MRAFPPALPSFLSKVLAYALSMGHDHVIIVSSYKGGAVVVTMRVVDYIAQRVLIGGRQ